MKKRSIALIMAILAVVLCFALAACGGDKNTDGNATAGNASDGNATAGDVVSDYEDIAADGKMVVGMTIYAPMNYKDENGVLTGFDTELAELVGEKLGLEVEFFEIGDWGQKFIELKAKNIDCVWNGMTITDEALNNSSVSIPYVKNEQVVVMKADVIDNYADAESMKELKFVAEEGSAGEGAAIDAGFNCTAVQYQQDALLEVMSGTADACVIDSTMAKSMTGEGTSYADLDYSISLVNEQYGISFRQGSDMTEKVNDILKELAADGTLKALADKYELTLADDLAA